jgi:hypothetical protein
MAVDKNVVAKRQSWQFGPNALGLVKALAVKKSPVVTVAPTLDMASVLEMLGMKGMSGAERLQALQSWAETLQMAKAEQEKAEAALVVLPALSPKRLSAEEAVAGAIRTKHAVQEHVVRLLLVMCLEQCKVVA